MTKITVPLGERAYDVHIGPGLLSSCGEMLSPLIGSAKAVLIADSNVAELYLGTVAESLRKCGISFVSMSFPAGEKSKNMHTLSIILEFMAKSSVNRRDVVIALGGGVTGDMAGLASALYMRGIRCVQLPTTLLAAVDSSVGGKTAVDLREGKNLVGAFHQPSLVICDTDTLTTLDSEQLSNGAAEAVKTGVIGDKELFRMLKDGLSLENAEEIIARCVTLKGDIVSCDELDSGKRQLLNLGHTVGHAIEKLSGYTVNHGHAVSAGLSVIARACAKKSICSDECAKDVVSALKNCGLPTTSDYPANELFEATVNDKKRLSSAISVAVVNEIGSCSLAELNDSELLELITLGMEANDE